MRQWAEECNRYRATHVPHTSMRHVMHAMRVVNLVALVLAPWEGGRAGSNDNKNCEDDAAVHGDNDDDGDDDR